MKKILMLMLIPAAVLAENMKFVVVDADEPMPWEEFDQAHWSEYPAQTNVNLNDNSIANADNVAAQSITLGGETRSNWPNVVEGAMLSVNNLSDVTDAATARSNLGLGSAAVSDTSAFDPAGSSSNVNAALASHQSDTENPHQVTATQIGALTPTGDGSQLTGITAAQVGALAPASNLADVTDAATARSNLGLGSAAVSDASAFDPAGAASNVGADVTAHLGDTNNPHQITAAQLGALNVTGGEISGDLTIVSNLVVSGTGTMPALTLGGETRTNWAAIIEGAMVSSNNLSDLENVYTARANLGLGSAAVSDTSAFDPAGAASNVDAALLSHQSDTDNPHQVTASQIGALTPTGDGSQLTGITAAQVGALAPDGDGAQLTVNGTNITELIGSGAFNPGETNLDMNTNRIVNIALPVDQDDAVSLRALWISLSNIPPMGDLSMGTYTNYAQ